VRTKKANVCIKYVYLHGFGSIAITEQATGKSAENQIRVAVDNRLHLTKRCRPEDNQSRF